MTTEISLSRRAAIALAGALAAAALAGSSAAASQTTESYVQANAQAVLTALAQAKSIDQRRTEFRALMDKFADMPRVAQFVLGKYARTARENPALYQKWEAAFRDYGLAVYEDQLDQYRGRQIRVLPGSQDTTINGRLNSIVKSQIDLPDGQPFLVNWRLIQEPDNSWKIVDVALKLDENVIWLAIQQREDFLARLDRNGGDLQNLIETVKAQTAQMRRRIAARN
jgi:phospholipid transport system substrate-binding protein